MTVALSINGQSLRDAFQAWHVERDAIDSQLSESLAALMAYQSHLDAWQQQLVDERKELQATRADFERAGREAAAARSELDRERETLHAKQSELDAGFTQLESMQQQLASEREQLGLLQGQVERERELAVLRATELEAQQADLAAALAESQRNRDELDAARRQFEQDLADTQSSVDRFVRERNELQTSKAELESQWSVLREARGKIEHERDQLRGERAQLERDRAAAEQGQVEASAAVMAELSAARDKVNALTASLLGRTEELRTLDMRRAETATELELMRARERELKAALEEQKRVADAERAHWKEELRQLREMLERRVEHPGSVERLVAGSENAPAPSPPSQPLPSSHSPTTGGGSAHVIPRENPVLGSIVQQFDKLRQQRASDRSANRPR